MYKKANWKQPYFHISRNQVSFRILNDLERRKSSAIVNKIQELQKVKKKKMTSFGWELTYSTESLVKYKQRKFSETFLVIIYGYIYSFHLIIEDFTSTWR